MTKRIVICSDGTWGKVDSTPTNVVEIHRAIRRGPSAGSEQRVFYDKGVGTGRRLTNKLLGGAFGVGLNKNVRQGYEIVIDNYDAGDDIYLFGFSRGAYTVRSVAGMIRNSGILRTEHRGRLDAAYALYRDPLIHPDDTAAREFRRDYSYPEPRITFLGVWDTVGAHGIPVPRIRGWLTNIPGFRRWHHDNFEFHDVELSGIVKMAYHALAIDERRKPFEPSLWSNTAKAGQTVEQVWFVGDHSNVGGGHPDRALSDIALHWIAGKARDAGLDIDQTLGGSGDPTGKLYRSPPWWMRPFGRYDRPIGQSGCACEDHHPTVEERRNDPSCTYRPANLEKYLGSRN